MIKLAFIINPIAGMGGSVGLKGTDGVVGEAILRGALPKAGYRSKDALIEFVGLFGKVEILTCSGSMGEDVVKELGFNYSIVYTSPDNNNTSHNDTALACKNILELGADLIIFVGGDGTARDVCRSVTDGTLCIGVPAGVKIHSEVFAKNPKAAGELIKMYIEGHANSTKEVEIVDLDEDEYRKGNVHSRLYGYLNIPYEQRFIQAKKSATPLSDKEAQYTIAYDVVSNMEEDIYYLIGPGSTTKVIMEVLGLENTLIGIDLILNKSLVQNDLTESDILSVLNLGRVNLIITPTGGQGYLLGRGNQQISFNVINKLGKENIKVVATKDKLISLKSEPLLVDVMDHNTNKYLEGYVKVITGHKEVTMYKIKS